MIHHNPYHKTYRDVDGFFDYIESLGGDIQSLATRTGITLPPYKKKFHYESWLASCSFYELAAKELGEPQFGLKWASNMPADYRSSGPTLFMGSIAANMKKFLDLVTEYQKSHTNGIAYSYEIDKEDNRLTGYFDIHPLSPPHRQFCEHIVGGVAIMGRRYIKDFALTHVSFQHNMPEDLTLHEKIFQCPIEFNAARNSLSCEYEIFAVEGKPFLSNLFLPALRSFLKVFSSKASTGRHPVTVSVVI